MQGIKVLVKDPVPTTTKNPDSFEDTLLLLDMLKEKKQRDKQSRKGGPVSEEENLKNR